jgi:arginase family enzyme
MNTDFLTPIHTVLEESLDMLLPGTLGNSIQIHTQKNGFPDLNTAKIAILGVDEDRSTDGNFGSGKDLHHIRSHFYKLFPGDWKVSIADLGNIRKGESTSDTHFAVKEVIKNLLKMNIVPILIGGGQDITFSNYKAYDDLEQTVNLVVVDSKFDLGNLEDKLSSKSYLSKIIMEVPTNLFNFSNIGYQTYLNPQEEIKLIQGLNFDTYRLAEAKELEILEPVLRDADIVSIDIGSVRQSDAPANKNVSPNGFYGDEICGIARYAGISDKVTSFGIYEYNSKFDNNNLTAHLIAQMIWCFIEGFNSRVKDYPFATKEDYQKFTVMLENDDPINFYKSNKTGRWWMEINLIQHNKYKRRALIPCTYQDYLETTNQMIPERWFKAQSKMI